MVLRVVTLFFTLFMLSVFNGTMCVHHMVIKFITIRQTLSRALFQTVFLVLQAVNVRNLAFFRLSAVE